MALSGDVYLKLLTKLTMDEYNSNKLKIKINNLEISVDISEICYCQADRCYSHIFMKSGRSYLISKPLKRLEKQLPKENFLRCHRSYLVNIHEIKSINEEGMLIIQELYQIPFSRGRLFRLLSEQTLRIITEQ